MIFKKFFALLLCAVITASLASCQKNDETDFPEITSSTSAYQNKMLSTTPSQTSPETPESTEQEQSSSTAGKKNITGPTGWNKSQVIDFYKRAASASDKSTVSEQSVTLQEFTISSGSYERILKIISPAMTKLLSELSSQKNGITGDFSLLNETDVKAAQAYTIGNNTAVELVLYDQNSEAESGQKNSSVSHAVATVKDVGAVISAMKRLSIPLEIPEDNVKINYTNATVRVLIDSGGKIINGTWSYRAIINLEDYSAFGQTIPSTRVVLDNTVTVNGGF